MNLFSFIHYFSRLAGLEFPLQKPCCFILLIMSLLRWFVAQSLIMISTHLSGMSRCSMVRQLPGGQEVQAILAVAGRSPARAHPAASSQVSGKAKGGRQLEAAKTLDHKKCLYWRGRFEVKPGSESIGQGQDVSQQVHGQPQRHGCNANAKKSSGANGLSLKAAPTSSRWKASLELFPTYSSEQFLSADIECSQLNS